MFNLTNPFNNYKNMIINFKLIDVAIGTAIGLTTSNFFKILIEEIAPIFINVTAWENFTINFNNSNINIGKLFLAVFQFVFTLLSIIILLNTLIKPFLNTILNRKKNVIEKTDKKHTDIVSLLTDIKNKL
jgi:large-conductance mechanosensitive channel